MSNGQKAAIATKLECTLHSYFDLLRYSLQHNSVVPEQIGIPVPSPPTASPRLLCQLRSIVFLEKYANLFQSNDARSLSEDLFATTNTKYKLSDHKWRSHLDSDNEADLYSTSFVIYAFSIYHQTRKCYVSTCGDLLQFAEHVAARFHIKSSYLQKITEDGTINQNATMHLFEALLELYRLKPSRELDQQIACIHQVIADNFYCHEKRAIVEEIDLDGRFLFEMPGQSYEWITLLWVAETLGISFENPIRMDILELDRRYLTAKRLVLDRSPEKKRQKTIEYGRT